MKKLSVMIILVLLGVSTAVSQLQVGFGGELHVGLQVWSKVGAESDPKVGFGLGGIVGVGIAFDSTDKFIIGPVYGMSRWSADYSDKPQSATSSVYVEMSEPGAGFMAIFDDVYITVATGKATIGSGMMVSGKDIKYPYDGDQYTFYQVGLGYKMGIFLVGVGFTSYTGYANYCDHLEIRLGMGI